MESQTTPQTRRQLSRRSRRSGFSLIELMVVIVIIAILGGGAVFMFRGAADDAKISRAAAEIGQMRTMISNYNLKFGAFPSDLNEAQDAMKQKFPELDPWNRPYEYRPDDSGFTLFSRGVDANNEADDVYYDSATGKVVTPDSNAQK